MRINKFLADMGIASRRHADEMITACRVTVNGEIATMVAVIRYADGTSYSFMNLAEAFAAAQDGDTVKLLQNTKISESIKNTKTIILDLNGKTLTNDSTINDYLVWLKNTGTKENTITSDKIKNVVCKKYNIKMTDMDSKKRKREFSHPRQVAMYL